MRIELLADHPEAIPALEKWFASEWADYYGPTGPGNARRDLTDYAGRGSLPVGLLAFIGDELCGIAVLKAESIGTHAHLTPWAAAGLVAPRFRRRGIAARLLDAVEDVARDLGYPAIYCGTSAAASLLTRNGWRLLDRARANGEDVSIYEKALGRSTPGGVPMAGLPADEIVRVRLLEPHEVGLHRDLRLRALREAPDSFGETLAEAEARPARYWGELTRSVTEPGRQVMFLACAMEHVCGSVYGLLARDRTDLGRVGGMWVEVSWRRRGVGRALLEEVIGWARGRRLSRLGLWAPVHNPAAVALYRSTGFRETGRRQSLPKAPALEVVEMERDL